jgi:hypothetical protein
MIPASETLFLRVERQTGGYRRFRLLAGEPLPTSYGEDLYQEVFGAGMVKEITR